MFNTLRNLFARFYNWNEAFRLIFMLGMIAIMFYPDFEGMKTMTYVLGVFLAIAFISHITRKYCLFNYVNMGDLVTAALRDYNMAAAIVFASICAVIMTCIVVSSQFFVR